MIAPITGTGTKHLIDIVTDAGIWTATAEHPIWVEGTGWTYAEHLTAGDQLRGSAGVVLVVRATHDRGWLPDQTVHNLHVATPHTYYIAQSGAALDALVHNTGCNLEKQRRHVRGAAEYALEMSKGSPRSYFDSEAIALKAAGMAMERSKASVVRGAERYIWDAGITVGWSSTGRALTRVVVQTGKKGWHAWPT